ncbi:hypothetical protein [Idiomarina baltica]|uniref:PhoD-like phosphatase metallophosphatase domain-containing protein n=1 Tax=Idiomarina baltica OS145 TaxID=314276 RepID=A0ABM9WQR6_9GAMM|nr:hypothetical protein [Idiomarina baltica]EAQ33257.1 hypothetical protein OS145_02775 [Idiomarina baltica OS145]
MKNESTLKDLPQLLCGPLVRHIESDHFYLWLVTKSDHVPQVECSIDETPVDIKQTDRVIAIGKHAYVMLIRVEPAQPLAHNQRIGYDLVWPTENERLSEQHDFLLYSGQTCPQFVYKETIDQLLHGSCRRPHHPADDGLSRADKEIQAHLDRPSKRAGILLHTGDQVYVDDVAGPMLASIHALIEVLKLSDETLPDDQLNQLDDLIQHPNGYYSRQSLLPDTKANEALTEKFFGGVKKPIFTSAHAGNHLITAAEVFAMYLLCWSPTPWRLIKVQQPSQLNQEQQKRFTDEQATVDKFVKTLPQAARAMAHSISYMMFDDHDVTDDWNLSAAWELTAYHHPFSKRIVGNALWGYLIFQGWGNQPEVVTPLMDATAQLLEKPLTEQPEEHDQLIEQLLDWEQWQFTLDTHPKILVLDTRTRRWRSERSIRKPSGLMDWESLMEMQHQIMDEEAVILVSPAPIFGVKLIEAIQTVFTALGKPLVVDAENWMAHNGAANTLLNIFSHKRTPQKFTILSGDVHYSFVYDVQLRREKAESSIWQITSSGVKNEFPNTLLEWLDRMNRWLYSPRSPLNWLTKRRRFAVSPRLPTGRDAGERLWNHSGIGWVSFDQDGAPSRIRQLNADGNETEFLKEE